jgi:hypothetical protein
MSTHVKLYIPGPVEVSPDTFAAMAQPMIGHRGKGFQDLYAEIQPMLQTLFGTKQQVFPEHVLGLGRDGGLDPQSGEEKGAQLLQRRLLRQVAGRFQALRQGSRGLSGRVGPADHGRRDRQASRHRRIRRGDLHPQ